MHEFPAPSPLKTAATGFAASFAVIASVTLWLAANCDGGFLFDPTLLVAALGAALAVAHGVAFAIVLAAVRPATAAGSVAASALAMEAVALLVCGLFFALEMSGGARLKDPFELARLAAGLVTGFAYLSAFLLVPAAVIGLVRHYFAALVK